MSHVAVITARQSWWTLLHGLQCCEGCPSVQAAQERPATAGRLLRVPAGQQGRYLLLLQACQQGRCLLQLQACGAP